MEIQEKIEALRKEIEYHIERYYNPVSYTHLDVYKRQFVAFVKIALSDSACFN